MKTVELICTLAVAMAAVFCAGCQAQDFGEMIAANGTEVYYTDAVQKADAEKLGKLLTDTGFSDGTRKSVQLNQEDGVWQFRMVTAPEFVDDEEMNLTFKHMCLELSDAFDGEKFNVHVCDNQLKTLKEVSGLQGVLSEIDAIQFYRGNVTDEQGESVKLKLRELELTQNTATFHFGKSKDKYQLRMVVQESAFENEAILEEIKGMAKTISDDCLEGAVFEFHLCDDYLQSRNFRSTSDE